jgi:4-phospho-D-threonate 3-dehydrogenase / 4-phospho-D-erythronate 3-dehydrogenase
MGTKESTLPTIGISCGDLNGIGMEVILQTFADIRMLELCTPVIFASAKVVSYHRKVCNLIQLHYQQVKSVGEIHPGKLNVVNVWDEDVNIQLGQIDSQVGKFSIVSLKACLDAFDNGQIDAVVTAPIHKASSFDKTHFPFQGHTGYLASRYKNKAIMLLMDSNLKVSLFTDHIPLKDVSSFVTPESVESFIRILHENLQVDFGLRKPRIAVFGLNPHAGDEGLIGEEDKEVIQPVISRLQDENMLVYGPFAADGFLGSEQHKKFDAIVAMYHDQGLAPFKALSFGSGVNVSLGLPVVRTSPDHGTGFDIAGQNIANSESFRKAVYSAIDIVKNRKIHKEVSKNPLLSQYKHRRGDN